MSNESKRVLENQLRASSCQLRVNAKGDCCATPKADETELEGVEELFEEVGGYGGAVFGGGADVVYGHGFGGEGGSGGGDEVGDVGGG